LVKKCSDLFNDFNDLAREAHKGRGH